MKKLNKKVGIVTFYGNRNYGNRLQNLALQETLKKLGFCVKTFKIDLKKINSTEKKNKISLYKKYLKNLFNYKKIIQYASRIISNILYKRQENQRYRNFYKFSNEYINYEKCYLSYNIPNNIINEYNYFIVGSDQVWNPYYIKDISLYFLSFAPNSKKISYAASFGVTELPQEYYRFYKENLNSFKQISVREKEGSEIIYDLINKKVPVVLDPTLLLSKNEWLSIASTDLKITQNYMLVYFLGQKSKEDKKIINFYAKKHNLKLIDILDKSDKDIYTSCPRQFLTLVYNSTLFCTNSFHGTVFAILFERPFIVFERKTSFGSMFSRIDTLLSTVKLESRIINNIKPDEELNCDFSHVEDILNKEREKSINYLKKALDIEE